MKPPIKIKLEEINNTAKLPTPIPLTDNPRQREPKKIPLTTDNHYSIYDIDTNDQIYTKNEDNKQNDKESIQQLESDKTN